MPNRIASLSLAVLCLAAAASAAGAAPPPLAQGQDYRLLTPPRPTSSPGKIEVLEFFSYGCPHCAKFSPLVSAWTAKLPKDVAFKRVPVSYGRQGWVNLSRTYYALEASGDLGKLDTPLFHAIHDEHENLFDEQSIAEWIGKQGGNAARFVSAYASFSVNNQTVHADDMAEDYGIEAIPTLVVNGRYVVVSPAQAADEEQTFKELLQLTDRVIALARADTAPAAAPAKAPAAKGH